MNWVERFATFCIERRVAVAVFGVLSTLLFAWLSLGVQIKTIFHDMLPVGHPYIQVNDEHVENFGGPNVVAIMVQVTEGEDIFQPRVLELIQSLTNSMYYVPAINQFQVTSLASRKLRSIKSSTAGIDSSPLMWPNLPESQAEIDQLREDVLSNPLVYGRYVSVDLKAALIQADFVERLIEYDVLFAKLKEIVEEHDTDFVDIRYVGNPVMVGYILNFLPETLQIFLATIVIMALVLLVTVRSLRGVVIPLFAGAVSAFYALGFAALFGINFDPLIIVIAFLVSARVVSHSVQMLAAWDDEIAEGRDTKEASRRALDGLFRPGMLGVATDAAAILIVAIMPMPLLQKTAYIGTVWVSTIALSGVVMTPVLLSWVRNPKATIFPLDTGVALRGILTGCSRIVLGKGAYVVLGTAVVVLGIAGYFAFGVTVGDARPGSPLLWPDHKFNQDAAAINDNFQGSDQMFIVINTDRENGLKRPELLANVDRFQRYVEAQPEIGGSVSLVDLLEPVNTSLHEGNRRFEELGSTAHYNATLLYMYMQGADPGDVDKFTGPKFRTGALTLFFRDHKGSTIRTAVSRIKQYVEDNPLPEGSSYELAGGYVGVMAAVNEEIFRSQVESIALALLVLFALAALAYRSTAAGLFFIPMVLISNAITFTYMTFQGIGMNINTLPVAALGIGLGVDYAFYMVDGVKERFEVSGNVEQSILGSMMTAGRGVLITGATMIVSVLMWSLSSLRFQAEMGSLIAVWLTVSAISSLLLIPSMVYVLRPAFVFGEKPAGRAAVQTS